MDFDPGLQREPSVQGNQERLNDGFVFTPAAGRNVRGLVSLNLQEDVEANTHWRDAQDINFTYRPTFRHSTNDSVRLNGRDRNSYAYDPNTIPHPHVSSSGPSRMSLEPRTIYNRQEHDAKTVNTAENYLEISQNLWQGMPLKRIPEGRNNGSIQNLLGQKSKDTIFHRQVPSVPQDQDQDHFLQGTQRHRINHLQPGKQQITPPFNLSGYIHTPQRREPESESSPFVPNSSPTAQISLRRAMHRAVAHDESLQNADNYRELSVTTHNIEQQASAPVKQTATNPQTTLALKHAPPLAHGIQLVSPHELPDDLRHVFPYALFNAVQSKVFGSIYKSDDNVVVSAPTGCGKTAILELAICRLLNETHLSEFKIVYQAPTKSLCSERVRDWTTKFKHLNLNVAELTGDTSQSQMYKVRDASIIVTTPEKWDSVTRNWRDHHKLLHLIRLFLIDEVHSLKDTRGATLEAVVSRMKTSGFKVRFIALSATVPNSDDIAVWLGKNHNVQDRPAIREVFGEDFRPVKLQKHVQGINSNANDFVFDTVIDKKLPALIEKYTHKKPIMIFCFTRKSCERTAESLALWWTKQRDEDRAWPASKKNIAVHNKQLQSLVVAGIAYHHAGLNQADRLSVETAYLQGDINVICSTSTLAVGVNLPCHFVILKGTVGYSNNQLQEYSDLEVMQMLGRAGRPQFDDNAVALILTRSDKVEKYSKMISGQQVLESTLHLNLIGHLNSEIGLETIWNHVSAQKWLMGTFLSVRMRQNPQYYKIPGISESENTNMRLQLVCKRDLKLLQEHNLITPGDIFRCTEYGKAMSRYMIQFETMKLLLTLEEQAKTEEILRVLCEASEFADLKMKASERKLYADINKNACIRYPIKENPHTVAHKISLIIQAQLGGVTISENKDDVNMGMHFKVEKDIVFERIQRLIRCIIDCKAYDCDAVATRHSLGLARSLAAQYWESSSFQLLQVTGFGPAAHQKLVKGNINSVTQIASLDTGSIERLLGRNPPYGKKIQDQIAGFPRLVLTAKIQDTIIPTRDEYPKVRVRVLLTNQNKKSLVWKQRKPSLTLIAETTSGALVYFWRGNIQKLSNNGLDLNFEVELCEYQDEITCQVACDEIVGTLQSCTLRPDIPALAFPLPKIQRENTKAIIPGNLDGIDEIDEFGDHEYDDKECLAAAQVAEESLDDYGSDAFADIDDLEIISTALSSKTIKEAPPEPVKMDNGKWECNHICRGRQPLKNGQLCKHKCCLEGLEKPRKLRIKDKPSSGTLNPNPSSLAQTQSADDSKQSSNDRISKETTNHDDTSSSAKRRINDFYQPKSKRIKDEQSEDIETIDLTNIASPVSRLPVGLKDDKKIHNSHSKVQENVSKRLTKEKPRFTYANDKMADVSFLKAPGKIEDPFTSSSPGGESSMNLKCQGGKKSLTFNHSALHFNTDQSSDAGSEEWQGMETLFKDLQTPKQSHTPEDDTNFENQIFDFAACAEEGQANEDRYSSPLRSALRVDKQHESPRAICRRLPIRSPSVGMLDDMYSIKDDLPATAVHDSANASMDLEEGFSKQDSVQENSMVSDDFSSLARFIEFID